MGYRSLRRLARDLRQAADDIEQHIEYDDRRSLVHTAVRLADVECLARHGWDAQVDRIHAVDEQETTLAEVAR